MLYFYLSGVLFFFFSLLIFNFSLYLNINKLMYFFEWNIFNMNSININMFLYIDWMSMMFMFTVMFISSMIMFYSTEYMAHDKNIKRFFYLMILFIMSMMLMILSPNLISILLGWDGLGLVSYCLVIYYQSFSSFKSGMITVLSNRIGDICLIMSLSIMLYLGSWNYMFYFSQNSFMLMLLLISSFTKSAQFPFSSWLPEAMAAPTPVSSLVHSSTLVTAGIYLLIRFNFMFTNLLILKFIMIIGLITMFMASISANIMFDLKKIIAFSTLSQLGLMMMIFSMKNYELTFFHLITHAMFKSLMFMCSGIMIHHMNNYQDIRFLSNIHIKMPITSSMLIVSSLSLSGLPFLSGFFSKDLILEFFSINKLSMMIYSLLMLSTMMTVMYNLRLLYYIFYSIYKFLPMTNFNDNFFMNKSMFLLMIFSLFFGWFLNWLIYMNINIIFMKISEKIIILIFSIFILMIYKYNFYNNFFKYLYFKKFIMNMWMLNNLIKMNKFYPLYFGKFWFYIYDKNWSEFLFKKIIIENLNFKNYYYKYNNNLFILLYFFMIILFMNFI
nr:NADH dehydrogenase subunit 5 [Sycophaga agraensis]